jgi:hypothetical protein
MHEVSISNLINEKGMLINRIGTLSITQVHPLSNGELCYINI